MEHYTPEANSPEILGDEKPSLEKGSSEMGKEVKFKHHYYTEQIIFWIRIIYIIFIVFWSILIWYFRFYRLKASYLLLIPYIVFIIGIANAGVLSTDIEEEMFRANFLSVGLLLALPLLNWTNKDYNGDRRLFSTIIILALVFSILSLFDIWVSKKWLSLSKHIRTCLQTFSLTLIMFGLVEYFLCKEGNSGFGE